MQDITVKVSHTDDHEFGLATRVVQQAARYKSLIYIELGEKRANAKSIMGMTYLTLMDGDVVRLTCEGEDEAEAMEALTSVLMN